MLYAMGEWGEGEGRRKRSRRVGGGKPVGEYSLRVYQSTTTVPVHIGPPQPSLVFMATQPLCTIPLHAREGRGERSCPKLAIVCGVFFNSEKVPMNVIHQVYVMLLPAENVCKICNCYLPCAAMYIVHYRYNLQSTDGVRRFLMLRPPISLCIVGILISYNLPGKKEIIVSSMSCP